MNHKNVIKLLDMVTSKRMAKDARRKTEIYMVLEWCDHDLSGLIHNPDFKFTEGVVKHFMKQIMDGFKYLHSHMGTLHRDVKPANILVNSQGQIKIADFGLARAMDLKRALTNGHRIVTRWDRSPELLLGSQKYDYSSDMWSVGCVFGELITGKPIFPAREEIFQLKMIFDICGTIDLNEWPEAKEFSALPQVKIQRRLKTHFRSVLCGRRWNRDNVEQALDLLDKLLTLTPKQRLTAAEGCLHPYFKCLPEARVPNLPKESHHEWKYNKARPSHHRDVTRHNNNRSHRQPLPHHNRHRGAAHHNNRHSKPNQRFTPSQQQQQRNKSNDHFHRERNNHDQRRNYQKPNHQNDMNFFDYGNFDYGI
jgi:serine/threonine protein kinase